MKFMLAMVMDKPAWDALDDKTRERVGTGAGEFMAKLKQSGHLVCTFALDGPEASKSYHGGDGEPKLVDGPLSDAKQALGGFYVVETENEKEAYELAATMPELTTTAFGIEVRPVVFSAMA